MTEYIVMFPADSEADWEAKTDEDRQRNFDSDYEFGQLLEARGGAVTGGAGLTPSVQARTLRRGADGSGDGVVVTEGPYAETVEQLSGFFRVTCESYDDLVECARLLTRTHPVVEIRPVQVF